MHVARLRRPGEQGLTSTWMQQGGSRSRALLPPCLRPPPAPATAPPGLWQWWGQLLLTAIFCLLAQEVVGAPEVAGRQPRHSRP